MASRCTPYQVLGLTKWRAGELEPDDEGDPASIRRYPGTTAAAREGGRWVLEHRLVAALDVLEDDVESALGDSPPLAAAVRVVPSPWCRSAVRRRELVGVAAFEVGRPEVGAVGGVPGLLPRFLRQGRSELRDLAAAYRVGVRWGHGDAFGAEPPRARHAHVGRRRLVGLVENVRLPLVQTAAAEDVGRRSVAGETLAHRRGWAWGERGG